LSPPAKKSRSPSTADLGMKIANLGSVILPIAVSCSKNTSDSPSIACASRCSLGLDAPYASRRSPGPLVAPQRFQRHASLEFSAKPPLVVIA